MACPPGMRGCAATCGHRSFVDGYRQERQRQEIAAENASLGYAEELRDWLRDNPIPTFKQWLVQSKRDDMPEHIPAAIHPDKPLPDLSESFMRFTTEAESNEASLLAIAMNHPAGVEALRALDPQQEFTNPFHTMVANAVLDLDDQGKPHDAGAVNTLLRERHQLPVGWDPTIPMRTIDPDRYGLGAWQSHALPGESAGSFASQIRSDYLPRHLKDICTRGAALADSATGDAAAAKAARLMVAQELVDFPPELGFDGKPVSKTTAPAIPQVWEPQPEQPVATLRLPQRPNLSPVGREVLSLRGA